MDDDDGLNIRNWGYYEPSFKEHLGLQLMSPLSNHRDSKPFISPRENPIMVNPNAASYHHQPLIPSHYMRESWIQRERLLHMLPGNNSFDVLHDTSASSSVNVMQPMEPDPGLSLDDIGGNDNDGDGDGDADHDTVSECPPKKRSRSVRKKPKKVKENSNRTGQRKKVMEWNLDMVINGIDMDITGIPIPVCSCTGTPQPCYRWGSGGWQSACCTTTISMYPLPMSTKRHGARIAGRKMSQGAFKKVLEKLASDGYNFADAIDLKSHWAKHGTNKFVTIR